VYEIAESSPGQAPVPIWLHASVHCERRPGLSRTAVLINFHMTESVRIALAGAGSGSDAGTNDGWMADGKMTAFVLGGDVYSDKSTLYGALLFKIKFYTRRCFANHEFHACY
jgi:hypothetical protein